MSERAEILVSTVKNTAAARIIIAAPANKVFDLLADPRCHGLFDGSGTVQGNISGPERLYLGAKFGMSMKIRLPYRITNTVVEFEENRKISWCHLMKWTWSYELVEMVDGSTQVTERFDGSQISRLATKWLGFTGAIERTPKWMAKSLVKLKTLCES